MPRYNVTIRRISHSDLAVDVIADDMEAAFDLAKRKARSQSKRFALNNSPEPTEYRGVSIGMHDEQEGDDHERTAESAKGDQVPNQE